MDKLVIDVYGADAGIAPIVKGAADTLKKYPDLSLVLVGNGDEILRFFAGVLPERLSVLDTKETIENADDPKNILGDNNSSMALALDYLKNNDDCIGLLSPGSTGALLIGSIFRLGLVKGLRLPALSSAIPTAYGNTVCLVDCGANLNPTAKDYARFALMGDAFIRSISPDSTPRVGTLTVGREATKGTPEMTEAHKLIEKTPLCFIGNVEGSDLASGYADVIVSDGTSGNILLKSTEATGRAAMKLTEDMLCAHPEYAEMLSELKEKMSSIFDLNMRGGATFLGTKKPIIKMHGIASDLTVVSCVDQLMRLNKAGFSSAVAKSIEDNPV